MISAYHQDDCGGCRLTATDDGQINGTSSVTGKLWLDTQSGQWVADCDQSGNSGEGKTRPAALQELAKLLAEEMAENEQGQ